MKYSGIILKRRDNFPLMKKIYKDILKMTIDNKKIMEKEKIQQMCYEYYIDTVKKLRDGKIELNSFIVTKSLSGSYKNEEMKMR